MSCLLSAASQPRIATQRASTTTPSHLPSETAVSRRGRTYAGSGGFPRISRSMAWLGLGLGLGLRLGLGLGLGLGLPPYLAEYRLRDVLALCVRVGCGTLGLVLAHGVSARVDPASVGGLEEHAPG